MHFRRFKDRIASPLHRFGYQLAGWPPGVGRAMLGSFGAVGKLSYFLPGSYARRTVTDFCHVTGRKNPWPVFAEMVDNLTEAALQYATLYRHGRAELLANTTVDAKFAADYSRLRSEYGGMLVLVSHCAGAVLSSAGLNHFCPSTLLVREPKSPERCRLMLEYVEKLGPKFILSRNTPPMTVMRNIARALREGQVVVGTTDLVGPGGDTIEARIFGQRVFSPAWPARISARFNVPIVPGFIHMEGRQIKLLAAEPYLEQDIERSTQKWVSSFEQWFRQYPSDWVFMLDKSWAGILAAAATQTVQKPSIAESNYSPNVTPN